MILESSVVDEAGWDSPPYQTPSFSIPIPKSKIQNPQFPKLPPSLKPKKLNPCATCSLPPVAYSLKSTRHPLPATSHQVSFRFSNFDFQNSLKPKPKLKPAVPASPVRATEIPYPISIKPPSHLQPVGSHATPLSDKTCPSKDPTRAHVGNPQSFARQSSPHAALPRHQSSCPKAPAAYA